MADAVGLQIVRFGTDRKAEAQQGGYYQAIATGIYRAPASACACSKGDRKSASRGHNYLHGDSAPAHVLIKRDNPEMTDALLAYGIKKLKEYGIVDSGSTRNTASAR
jgi:hypothetical protein